MSHGGTYLTTQPRVSQILPPRPTIGRGLFHIEAAELSNILNVDAIDNFYSGAVSLSDAINGVDHGYFSWATVKLYYSLFYALRAILCLTDHCIFYYGSKPRWILAQAGARANRTSGTTHKCVLTFYRSRHPQASLLSQPIEAEDSLDWLLSKRETANYRSYGFEEPRIPSHFEHLMVRNGIRRALEAYIGDQDGIYAFDPDHAAIALPVRALGILRNELSVRGSRLESERADFLRKALKDSKGPFTSVREFLLSGIA
jgi:hypothetical protein